MNLLNKIVRLPFVANHPAARLLGFAAVTAIDIASRTPVPLPAAEPVARFEILGVANKLIQYFLSSKQEQVSFIKWCLGAGLGLAKSVFSSLTSAATDNQITAANVPNIMAGKIAGNALVPGLNTQVFVIALSPNMMILLGFLFLCVKSLIIGTGAFYCICFASRYVFPTDDESSRDSDSGQSYIDVPSKGISHIKNRYLGSSSKFRRNV